MSLILDDWACRCGANWHSPLHKSQLAREFPNQRQWHGKPWGLIPWDQWVRENMPAGTNGWVHNADDQGMIRIAKDKAAGAWLKRDKLPTVLRFELKSNGAGLDHSTRQVLRAEADPQCRLLPISIEIDGDVPTPLRHWPLPCSCCGAPGSAEPSTYCQVRTITGDPSAENPAQPVAPDDLAGWLLGRVGWIDRWMASKEN